MIHKKHVLILHYTEKTFANLTLYIFYFIRKKHLLKRHYIKIVKKMIPKMSSKCEIFSLKLMKYMERTWLKQTGSFPPRVWNMFGYTGSKTNNPMEGFVGFSDLI